MTVNPLTYKTLDRPGIQSARSGPRFLWVVSQEATEEHGYSTKPSPPQPLEDCTISIGDFYRPQTMGRTLAPKHDNMLMVRTRTHPSVWGGQAQVDGRKVLDECK
ncbi:Fungalysin/Thermolysin Extracellular metalloproteinase 5 [Ceratobasidium sp. 370]|nr:Fungalysin/Thermolysin Extracellular metalloproteinase 5 [Ceratobasidium sp. 370]